MRFLDTDTKFMKIRFLKLLYEFVEFKKTQLGTKFVVEKKNQKKEKISFLLLLQTTTLYHRALFFSLSLSLSLSCVVVVV